MKLLDKVSQAVHNSKLYNLGHFHEAWENPDVRRLMGNELLYPPSPQVIEAVQSMIPYINYYPEDAPTNKKLLTALADYVGIEGGSDWITLGNGSMEIIDMLPHAFINQGDEILLPAPDYSPYSRRPLIFGAKIVDIFPDEDYEYKFEDFTSKITPKTKMVIMSRPNAPVGNLIDRGIIEKLCGSELIVVVDEAYAEFSEENVCDLVPKYENLIISRTFSKAMGLGGIRLGFIAAHPEVIGYVNRIRLPENISVLTQTAALAALEDIEYIKTNVKLVIKSRDWFQIEVGKIPGIKVFPSKGNSVLLNVDETGKTAEEFVNYIRENGYLVRNLSGGRNLPGKGFFRVTVGTQEDMESVAKFIKEFA
ncbi:MAG TPA: aminotransferase class I/II-fold pyridoxal phosphate-dependent enzyme [Pelolinea sp.]|nr:aminotransferase class I/II-fold pyridoxal phosphate-dependent enzyme [Pelolinea sp.]